MDGLCAKFFGKVLVADEIGEVMVDTITFPSDEKQIQYFLNAMLKYNMIPEEYDSGKNAAKSERFRQCANRLFVSVKPPFAEGKCVEILKAYNKSIAYAPRESQQLALAYANRSAVLIKLRKYKLCIEDIDRALALIRSDNVCAQLFIRKIECLSALGHSKVKGVIAKARCWFEKLSLEGTLKEKFIKKLNSIDMARNKVKRRDSLKQSVLKINNPNIEAPCASDAVRIAYNKKYGRHLVATRDIEPEELLIVEEPYSMVLALEKVYSNCSNCFETSWASIPCDYCPFAMYCSENCKNTNWKKCHDIECTVFLPVLEASPYYMDINLCSLKLVVRAVREFASIEELRKEVNEVDNCKDLRTKGFSANGVLSGDKYRNVLGLETNTNKRLQEELIMISLHSCYILYYLATETNLFGKPLEKDLSVLANNNDVLFIGSLLLRHLQLSRVNGQNIPEKNESGSWAKRGFGILPFSSLINHSCNPNTVIWHKSKNVPLSHAIIRHFAKGHIKKGEQLYVDYLYDPFLSKAERRKLLLKYYHFKCQCPSCQS